MMRMRVLALLALLSISLQPVLAQGPQDRSPELIALLKEKDPALQIRLKELGKGRKEADLILLESYYGATQKGQVADSINKVILKKYPVGLTAFTKGMHEIFDAKSGPKAEKLYADYVKRFSKNLELKEHRFWAYTPYYVGLAFINEDPKKMMEWTLKVKDTVYRTQALSYGAQELLYRDKPQEAEPFIRAALADITKDGKTQGYFYEKCCAVAAQILLANGKYAEGYEYAILPYKNRNTNEIPIDDTYLNLLVGTGRYAEAFPGMIESVKGGKATPLIKERLEKAFRAVNGEAADFKSFQAGLQKEFEDRLRDDIAKTMENTPAYNFTLVDREGKAVTLESLRGKVLVLDFWATWCAPCKASFPKMQLAVNKYKNDPDVEFLFIHTLEKGEEAAATAYNYVETNKFTFNVMMDFKDPETKINPAAKGFGLTGIPAKFIIDKKGNIRFRAAGFRPVNDETFLTEISTMVELARKS